MCTLDLFEHVNCSLYRFIPCNVIFFFYFAFCSVHFVITILLLFTSSKSINYKQSDFLMFNTQMLMII